MNVRFSGVIRGNNKYSFLSGLGLAQFDFELRLLFSSGVECMGEGLDDVFG